jgi:hypothetical protein
VWATGLQICTEFAAEKISGHNNNDNNNRLPIMTTIIIIMCTE